MQLFPHRLTVCLSNILSDRYLFLNCCIPFFIFVVFKSIFPYCSPVPPLHVSLKTTLFFFPLLVAFSLLCRLFCVLPLHHVGIQIHKMALSHFLFLHPCRSSVNRDVDQHLILFPLFGGSDSNHERAGRRDTTTTPSRHKETLCLWVF